MCNIYEQQWSYWCCTFRCTQCLWYSWPWIDTAYIITVYMHIVSDRSLEWFKSYLTAREQVFTFKQSVLDPQYVVHGIRQGSRHCYSQSTMLWILIWQLQSYVIWINIWHNLLVMSYIYEIIFVHIWHNQSAIPYLKSYTSISYMNSGKLLDIHGNNIRYGYVVVIYFPHIWWPLFYQYSQLILSMFSGVHSGRVTCGVAGHRVPKFCVLGETVLVATKLAHASIISTLSRLSNSQCINSSTVSDLRLLDKHGLHYCNNYCQPYV